MQTIEIHNAEEYQNALSSGIIEPGDLMYFGDIGKDTVHHATMITNIDDNGIYYSGKSVERNNEQLNSITFEKQYVSIIHMN